ncbi:hypothetical protein PPERSA_01455 [Pseudocohnilembus persalinus]|uniref:Uncharacterized protein n=1 Tax=Pseudocohnilembus persalinus TaxID=266149 RepID=A0A0V0QHM6_PSEPJ|nr:hypothetical protein PPERSA_01455 [Pseudocohnilembus persalinus]|eukprot:KRX01552.1 hypothetical protein PPERSA_01455 [Pseudocohnilembus persalinus]
MYLTQVDKKKHEKFNKNGIIFTKIKMEYMDQIIDAIYDYFQDTLWFKYSPNEQQIKQSIFDKINHPKIIQTSLICLDQKKENKVIAGYFCCDLGYYLSNNYKWRFNENYTIIEKTLEILVKDLSQQEIQYSLFGFWSFNMWEDSMPEVTDIIVSQLITQAVIEGYQCLYSFDYGTMEHKEDAKSNQITLQPTITYLRKAFRHTFYLQKTVNQDSLLFLYVDESVKWVKKIQESEDRRLVEKQYSKLKNTLDLKDKDENKIKFKHFPKL